MHTASTIQQVREVKSENAARVGAVNNATTNGTNNNTNNNAAVDQSEVVKTDTVEVSQKSVALAAAAKTDTASKATETPKVATTATQSEPKVEKATEKVTAQEKSADTKTNYRKAMKQSQHELRSVVKDLKEAGVGRREIGKIVRHANRAANKTIGTEIRQAYKDYRGKEINRSEFKNKLYGSAVKKLDSIVSALKDALAQKKAPKTEAVKETAKETNPTMAKETRVTSADEAAKANAEKSAEAAKENANATKSDNATNATGEARVTDADDAAKANADRGTAATKEKADETKLHELFGADKARVTNAKEAAKANAEKSAKAAKEAANKTSEKAEKTENGNVVKAEKTEEKEVSKSNKGQGNGIGNRIGNGNGIFGPGGPEKGEGPGNEFGQLVSFFNEIDKMINGLVADEVEEEGKGNVDKDKGDSLLNFAAKLNDMFSGINKVFGRQSNDNVGHRLGVAQVDKEKIGQLFDNGHGSGAINRIGDAGEGTGNFNAASFMSSMSSGINDALDSYKDIQKGEKEAKEEATKEESNEAVSTLA